METRVARAEAQIESIFHELKGLREDHRDLHAKIENIQELTIAVKEIAFSVSEIQKEQVEIKERLKTIEQEPVQNAKQNRRTLITAIISSAITAIVSVAVTTIIHLL